MQLPIHFGRANALRAPILLTALFSGCLNGAAAADVVTTWSCAYDQGTNIACRLTGASDSESGHAYTPTAAGPGPTSLHDARQGRLPAIVRTLREQPGALAGRVVLIPLHTEPTEPLLMRQLAQAVMCGSRAGCRVEFVPGRTELARMSPQELADATDAALED